MGGERIDVVIPVFNEEKVLEMAVEAVLERASAKRKPWRVIIADNGSTDGTRKVGRSLVRRHGEVVRYGYRERAGRGGALRTSWNESDATFVGYMDVDLSTTLDGFEEVAERVQRGECDIAVGSRFAVGAKVRRSWGRAVMSHVYSWMVRATLGSETRDFQCGCKVMRRGVFNAIEGAVESNGWFFDTEMLINAWEMGYRIEEVPVEWREVVGRKSRVKIINTVVEDIMGVMRLKRGRGSRIREAGGRVSS